VGSWRARPFLDELKKSLQLCTIPKSRVWLVHNLSNVIAEPLGLASYKNVVFVPLLFVVRRWLMKQVAVPPPLASLMGWSFCAPPKRKFDMWLFPCPGKSGSFSCNCKSFWCSPARLLTCNLIMDMGYSNHVKKITVSVCRAMRYLIQYVCLFPVVSPFCCSLFRNECKTHTIPPYQTRTIVLSIWFNY
jgi:hypothetical protein